jgi:hypothetical protein
VSVPNNIAEPNSRPAKEYKNYPEGPKRLVVWQWPDPNDEKASTARDYYNERNPDHNIDREPQPIIGGALNNPRIILEHNRAHCTANEGGDNLEAIEGNLHLT